MSETKLKKRKCRAYAKVVGLKYLGVVEATSRDGAVQLAYELDEASINMCHQCSEECEDSEIDEVIVELED